MLVNGFSCKPIRSKFHVKILKLYGQYVNAFEVPGLSTRSGKTVPFTMPTPVFGPNDKQWRGLPTELSSL